MKKHFVAVGLTLVSSVIASCLAASYLLNQLLLFAIALYALCFCGGLWLLPISRSAIAHALWVGLAIGLIAAFFLFLPSVSFA